LSKSVEHISDKKSSKKRSWWKYILYLIFFLFFLFFLASLLIQLPAVQNFSVNKGTDYLSKKIGSHVSIDEVHLSLIDGVIINGLYIEDENGDTLIYSRKFSTSFGSSLRSIANRDITFNRIYLEGARVNINTAKNDHLSNLDKVLNSLSPNSRKDGESKPFLMSFEGLDIKDSAFRITNDNTGSESFFGIVEGVIDVRDINLQNRIFDIERIELDSPKILIKSGTETVQTEKIETEIDPNPDSYIYQFYVQNLRIKNGTIDKQVVGKDGFESAYFDKDNFKVESLDIQIQDSQISSNGILKASLEQISGKVNETLTLEDFHCDSLVINDRGIEMSNFGLKTNRSTISQQLFISFNKFSDLRDSLENVTVNANFENIDFSVKDILYFAPALADISFIKANQNNTMKLKGKLNGDMSNLSATDIQISIGDNTYFEGNVSAKNLNKKDEELINITIKQLESSITDLQSIIPGLSLPDNFKKLGRISFEGLIDGFVKDFVVFGSVNSDMGKTDLDIRIDMKKGIQNVSYSGFLDLVDFNLGEWTDNPDFKTVNLSAQVKEGSGLVLNTANATLETDVVSFWYKDYEYKNILFNGILNKNNLNGNFSVDDQNVSLKFDGSIESLDSFPQYHFTSSIAYIDLNALNLSLDKIQLSGDFELDMDGQSLRTMEGTGRADQLLLVKNDSVYSIDSILIESHSLPGDNMHFAVESDLLNLEAQGKFDLTKVPQTFLQILKTNYPYQTRSIHLNTENNSTESYDYTLNIDIKDTKNILELAGVKNLRLKNTEVISSLNSDEDQFDIEIETPSFSFNDLDFMNVKMKAFNKNNEGKFVMTIDSSMVQSMRFNPMKFESVTKGDTINFSISTEQVIDSLQNVSLSGQLIPHVKGYEINIEKNELYMLDKNWLIDPRNKIVIGAKYLDLENLMISDSYRAIAIDDINNEGLSLDLYRFNIDLLNPIIDYDKMIFKGEGNTNVKINSVFGNEQFITGYVEVPDFRVNDDSFGELLLKIQKKNNVEALDIEFAIAKDTQNVMILGGYDLDKKELDVIVDMDNYPLNIFEYIIPEGISQTSGTVDIDARINGDPNDLKLDGEAIVENGASKIDYLGTYYIFDQQRIKLSESFIDATGSELTDIKGNTAVLKGGLNHTFFTDMTMDINISSPRFIGLNTTKKDNPLYYGLGEGNMSVDFSGPFSEADIYVEAVTAPTARLSFPISTAIYDYDESFIRFKTKEDTLSEEQMDFKERYKLLGLNFEMNVELTEEANVEIIFDERVGEILKGNGYGNISLNITRTGVFEVFGDYNVTGGEYLFSAYGLIAKPFKIKRGGSLRWTGDPFDASLDVEAEYTGVRAPLNVFLSEYINSGSQQLEQEARTRTDVNLQLILDGTLYKPDVNFDIEFPEVTGELKSYADSKMRTLRSTDNGINNQVVGLLLFKNFLPYDNPLSNISGSNSLVTFSNNVTEFFTSQLGLVLNDLIAQGLSDDSFIRGIDVNIGLNENKNIFDDQTGEANFIPDEIDVNTRYYFKNENFVLNVGGNYVWEPTYGVESYIVGDVILDYFISDDRKLKLQIYSKFDYDETEGYGRKYKNGFGITYRNEFGSISDFVDRLDVDIQTTKTDQSGINR